MLYSHVLAILFIERVSDATNSKSDPTEQRKLVQPCIRLVASERCLCGLTGSMVLGPRCTRCIVLCEMMEGIFGYGRDFWFMSLVKIVAVNRVVLALIS